MGRDKEAEEGVNHNHCLQIFERLSREKEDLYYVVPGLGL